jgi:hypothetical protein
MLSRTHRFYRSPCHLGSALTTTGNTSSISTPKRNIWEDSEDRYSKEWWLWRSFTTLCFLTENISDVIWGGSMHCGQTIMHQLVVSSHIKLRVTCTRRKLSMHSMRCHIERTMNLPLGTLKKHGVVFECLVNLVSIVAYNTCSIYNWGKLHYCLFTSHCLIRTQVITRNAGAVDLECARRRVKAAVEVSIIWVRRVPGGQACELQKKGRLWKQMLSLVYSAARLALRMACICTVTFTQTITIMCE